MIRILGAGAWGTALAALWAHPRTGVDAPTIELIAHTAAEASAISATRMNSRRLPGVTLPESIRIRSVDEELSGMGAGDLLVVAIPSDAIRGALSQVAVGGASVVMASKGLSREGERVSELAVAAGVSPSTLFTLSGPNLAREIAAGKPAAAVLATQGGPRDDVLAALARPTFRIYMSDDPIGVEVAGALKNVLAIAVSGVRSLGYGENAAAALLSRGVAEMARLAEACGGRAESAFGLAGVGDLVLTASNTGSRNARLGELLATGATVSVAVETIGATVEGIPTAHGALLLAARLGVELPITAAVVAALEHGVSIERLAEGLLGRAPTAEWH
jgi:glycerol-3-phosphate dehydrogenase (NAD(P)+)